jgi:hypothetical protein
MFLSKSGLPERVKEFHDDVRSDCDPELTRVDVVVDVDTSVRP